MNSSELVSYVRELGSLPEGRFSDSEILGFANQETLTIVKDIISANQDYLVEAQSFGLSASFRVPPRALGGKVRDIVVQMQVGGATTPGQYVNIPRVDLSDRYANPIGYYYNGNRVVMWNVINAIGQGASQVLVSYYARPGRLVPTGSALLVTSITGTDVTGTGADPRTFSKSDLIKGSPGFETIYVGQTQAQLSGASATTFVVNPTAEMNISGSTIEVGDWLSAADTSPVIQLPQEFHQVLAQRTIVKCLESIGDNEGFSRAQAKAGEMQEAALKLISERDDGHPEKFRLDVYSPWVYANRYRWWR
jgi:hypothetical protein